MSGLTLREIRCTAKRTLSDASRALGISVPGYWRKEAGKRCLRTSEAIVLAELFGASIEAIVLARRERQQGASDQ